MATNYEDIQEIQKAVEKEAVEFRWQWMKLTGRVPPPAEQE